MRSIEDHGKQMVESNELIKKNFNIDIDSIPHEEQKIYLINLLEKGILSFKVYKKDIILIIWFISKKWRRSPKNFRNYQNVIKLFKDFGHGNINPKKVLKDQFSFKSDLII